jgi:hypothetical protein
MQRALRKTRMLIARRWRAFVLAGALLTFGFFLVIVFIVIEYAGTFSIAAITDTSTTLLTVEGFLLGLSPLFRDGRSRVLPITLGIVAIMSSLLTIESAHVLSTLQDLYPNQHYAVTTPYLLGVSTYQYFTGTVALFMFMIEVYWGSATGPSRKRLRQDAEMFMY